MTGIYIFQLYVSDMEACYNLIINDTFLGSDFYNMKLPISYKNLSETQVRTKSNQETNIFYRHTDKQTKRVLFINNCK